MIFKSQDFPISSNLLKSLLGSAHSPPAFSPLPNPWPPPQRSLPPARARAHFERAHLAHPPLPPVLALLRTVPCHAPRHPCALPGHPLSPLTTPLLFSPCLPLLLASATIGSSQAFKASQRPSSLPSGYKGAPTSPLAPPLLAPLCR